jgi:Lrp/AsnC family transcriptional regulator, leucine-responsive regulatory protein
MLVRPIEDEKGIPIVLWCKYDRFSVQMTDIRDNQWQEWCLAMDISEVAGIDEIDRRILQELTSDARIPFAELGRRVSLSPSAAAERVRQLESIGLIKGYRAEIDLPALGYTITAFIRLTCDGNRYRPFLKFLQSLDSVQECHHLTGGDAFLLRVMLRSIAQLEDLIERLLPYGTPTTSMVLSTPLKRNQDSHLLRSL